MIFDAPTLSGTLIKRYKRFLADVILDNGEVMTAHTPNTGSMKGCAEPGSRVWLRDSGNDKRKYRYTWDMVEVAPGVRVGIHTGNSNRLVEEAIGNGTIDVLQGYQTLRREVRYGNQKSRIDLLLQDHADLPDCYVEVKNVTLVEQGIALFPDAVTARGTKHLQELMDMVAAGRRAALVFCVQRSDASEMRPADDIDPLYGRTLREAAAAGVELLAWRARVEPAEVVLSEQVPVHLPRL